MIVLTQNRSDFVFLAQQNRGHHGVITIAYTTEVKRLAKAIDEKIKSFDGRLDGQIIHLSLAAHRKSKRKKR